MHRLLISSLVLLAACGDKEDTEDTEDTNPTPTPATDTDEPIDSASMVFAPNAFAVGVAEFAVDADGNAVGFSGFDQAGTPITVDPRLTIIILDESATTTINSTNSCQVTLSAAGPIAPATWATDAGTYWGFTLPSGAAVIADTCAGFEFPGEWGGDVGAVVAQWDWGFALNVMDPNIESQLAANPQFAAIQDNVVGAGWYSNLVSQGGVDPNGYADGGFAVAAELDENFQVVTDGAGNPTLLESGDIWFSGATQPAVGAYTGQGVIFIQPANTLLGTPQ